MRFWALVILVFSITLAQAGSGQAAPKRWSFRDHYQKYEYNIPMRDGVKLYVNVYVPKDKPGKHPILMERTPYHADPYGADVYPSGQEPTDRLYEDAGYILARADVRGSGMSEGEFVNERPQLGPGQKGIDESTDTYDTIDYLVKHVPDNNGQVGLRGISYPGFYAAVGGVNTHPSLKAISPQAPVSNWFLGDDIHHNGAFFLEDVFSFLGFFGGKRTELGQWGKSPSFERDPVDYNFFLQSGALPNYDRRYYKGQIEYWNEILQHPDYDDYWKTISAPEHMVNVKCAVLTVGGWYDAEDMWGALNPPKAIGRLNPRTPNYQAMGPWFHGQWGTRDGSRLGDISFGGNTSAYFQQKIEFPFFERYLRGIKEPAPAKATMFETGRNQWHKFAQWPPFGLKPRPFYFEPGKALGEHAPTAGADTYTYDPANPTPYTPDYKTSGGRGVAYMLDDQRFAERRSDVLTYKGPVLSKDLTAAGPVNVDLWVTTTGTDADFVVKLIDGWPSGSKALSPRGRSMAGYEEMVRADVFRGKYRKSFESPSPFKPGEPSRVHFKLNDLYHTFLKGHRLIVQVQSAWFPLVDRNSNTFENLYTAKDSDFHPAKIAVLHDRKHPSWIGLGILGK